MGAWDRGDPREPSAEAMAHVQAGRNERYPGFAPAPVKVPRVVLQDRWDAVMELNRTGGNASPQYEALLSALGDLAAIVVGSAVEWGDVLDDDTLFAVGEIIVARVDQLGVAR
jgi:hypothetical protein